MYLKRKSTRTEFLILITWHHNIAAPTYGRGCTDYLDLLKKPSQQLKDIVEKHTLENVHDVHISQVSTYANRKAEKSETVVTAQGTGAPPLQALLVWLKNGCECIWKNQLVLHFGSLNSVSSLSILPISNLSFPNATKPGSSPSLYHTPSSRSTTRSSNQGKNTQHEAQVLNLQSVKQNYQRLTLALLCGYIRNTFSRFGIHWTKRKLATEVFILATLNCGNRCSKP